ncbi:oocyte zinc finger protein XlCOF6-like [Dermacentor albipictus]|uniref:oocyte zinc finger protein XlCOF6-like n=1 Tax=Dermacentor albipictus TaxID=60249 RepID=UPI0038FCBDBB
MYATVNCTHGPGMHSCTKKQTFTHCTNLSEEVYSQEIDTKEQADEVCGFQELKDVSSNLCGGVAQKLPVNVACGHEVPDTEKCVKQHPGKRWHVCSSCLKMFANNDSLQCHYRTHCRHSHSEFCPKAFLDGTGLTEHGTAQVSAISEMFICTRCSRSFSSKDNFDRHVLEHGVKQTDSCHLCPEEFDDAFALQGHIDGHELAFSVKCSNSHGLKFERDERYGSLSKPRYSCDFCTVEFADEAVLTEHVEIAHSCELHSAAKKPLMNKHRLDVSGAIGAADFVNELPSFYNCTLCPESFKDSSTFTEHVRVAHSCERQSSDKKPSMSERFNITARATDVDDSVDNLSSVRAYDCNLCPESFEDASSLVEHVRNDHPMCPDEEKENACCRECAFVKVVACHTKKPNPVRHACHLCPEELDNSVSLQQHVCTAHGTIAKHSNTKSLGSSKQTNSKKHHSCDQCSKSFRSKGHLTRHLVTHTSKRPFECHLCPATFSQKGILQRHVHRHVGYKRFSCPQCAKRFVVEAEMRIHLRTHTGERPYTCEHCSAAFSARDNLKKHVTTHTGVRPFTCEQCPRSFLRFQDLKRHSRRHTGERPFACTSCPKTFTRGNLLRDHVEAAHNS